MNKQFTIWFEIKEYPDLLKEGFILVDKHRFKRWPKNPSRPTKFQDENVIYFDKLCLDKILTIGYIISHRLEFGPYVFLQEAQVNE